ncbi:MMPL family transporter [Nocardia goodfellowii]|uniref:RND superfamily putative drug exporter n=1 Tax=Nocardia goodfellowii TaxID=882446 RepID=A0ABS4QNR5_9NOCA|nr:MMPL family transporter [Nocardia goodfellowii]MBP2192770.1 RND superfamily putative drug exporter [Nocardia goodfellowii]
MSIWDRYGAVVTHRRSWALLLVLLAIALAIIGGAGGNDAAGESPKSLPDNAQSTRIEQVLDEFPDAGAASVIAVVTRSDGGQLGQSDRQAAAAAVTRAAEAAGAGPAPNQLVAAPDGAAVLGQVPISGKSSGTALTELVERVRAAARAGLPAELTVEITGGPAFAADIADSFSGADVTLLAVTAAVVAVLLIVTYRSPILWLLPLLIIGLADRVANAAGTGLSRLTDITFDGSTSGITSVLVFGAGTNYALLLISRYRDELHRDTDHRRALRRAVRRAGPAIVASNLTVVMALLILVLASVPSTRSLGVFAAAGLVIALLFALVGLPAALALCGRKVFWPYIPASDDQDLAEQGVWHAVATRVIARPVRVAGVTVAGLLICVLGLFTVDVGLSQTEQFRVRAESVTGFDTLAAHFPAGSADPAQIVARASAAPGLTDLISSTPGVVRATPTGTSPTGWARWTVLLDAEPGSDRAFRIVESLRTRLDSRPEAEALVGGNDAQALDSRTAAGRDRLVLIPLILAAVCAVLLGLLRAVPAALLLVAVTVLSALAALGIGSWLSVHLFGFPAMDTAVPLFAFLFLVALGVDYTIFLVTRAREETPAHGTEWGMVRAVSSTGAVITSAGIVLAAVFCVLGVLPLITLTQLGIVVGVGILLDTFVVRTVIIPALFSAIGAKVWWPGDTGREKSNDRAVEDDRVAAHS